MSILSGVAGYGLSGGLGGPLRVCIIAGNGQGGIPVSAERCPECGAVGVDCGCVPGGGFEPLRIRPYVTLPDPRHSDGPPLSPQPVHGVVSGPAQGYTHPGATPPGDDTPAYGIPAAWPDAPPQALWPAETVQLRAATPAADGRHENGGGGGEGEGAPRSGPAAPVDAGSRRSWPVPARWSRSAPRLWRWGCSRVPVAATACCWTRSRPRPPWTWLRPVRRSRPPRSARPARPPLRVRRHRAPRSRRPVPPPPAPPAARRPRPPPRRLARAARRAPRRRRRLRR